MTPLFIRFQFALLVLVTLALGCNSPWGRGNAMTASHDRTPPSPVAQATPAPVAQEPAVDEQELSAVLAELEEIGTLDPELKQKIIADLRETKPSLWGPTVQVYRGALAYRQQVEKREAMRPSQLAGYQTTALTDSAREVDSSSASSQRELPERRTTLKQPEPLPRATGEPPAGRDNTLRPLPPTDLSRASRPTDATSDDIRSASHSSSQADAMSPLRRDEQVQPVSARVDVGPIDVAKHADLDWQGHLEAAIEGLDSSSTGSARDEEELGRQVALRLLNLAASNREEAVRPIEGVSSAQQDFWQKQIYSIATNVDTVGFPDPRLRAAEARRHLDDANIRLGELSGLAARNLAFCTEISSYGVYEAFEENRFSPGQEVLLYAEIDNFKSVPSEQGFVTKLRSSYQILDSRGARVFDDDFATTEDVCRNRRRDFFMRYRIWIPKRIFDGEYTLKLTIEDEGKQEIGQASINFEITEEER